MTRITSFNILAGGYDTRRSGTISRAQEITAILRSTQPDIVGIPEATNPLVAKRPFVIEQLAEALNMQLVPGSDSLHYHDFQTALLTKLPIVYKKIYSRPGLLTRPLIEVCVEEKNGEQLVVFVTHLAAAFSHGWAGNSIRMREIKEILSIMAQVQDTPHLIMGDFNSMAPGDAFKASYLLRYLVEMDKFKQKGHLTAGNPHLNFVVPGPLRIFNPLLRLIPSSERLCNLFDGAASLYAPRGPIAAIQQAGYVDSYRKAHADSYGFSCPSAAPAGRIDFIFASPLLANRLETCDVVLEGEGVRGSQASDHLAVSAIFSPVENEGNKRKDSLYGLPQEMSKATPQVG